MSVHYDELVELTTMGRELDEEERSMLKKDAWSKCGKGVFLLSMLIIAVVVVVFILWKMNENSIVFGGRAARKITMLVVVALASAIAYILVTFKHSFIAMIFANKAKVIEVGEVNFKELDKAGYKHYGDVTVKINGSVKILEVPIMRDSVKMVMWQRKGRLYFVPERYYMLGKLDK